MANVAITVMKISVTLGMPGKAPTVTFAEFRTAITVIKMPGGPTTGELAAIQPAL
jgi:hypothetical protein